MPPMKWTGDFPTKTGYYWFDGHLGRDGDKTDGPEIVRILASPAGEGIPGDVTVNGRNNKYGLHSCKGNCGTAESTDIGTVTVRWLVSLSVALTCLQQPDEADMELADTLLAPRALLAANPLSANSNRAFRAPACRNGREEGPPS